MSQPELPEGVERFCPDGARYSDYAKSEEDKRLLFRDFKQIAKERDAALTALEELAREPRSVLIKISNAKPIGTEYTYKSRRQQ